MSILGVWSWHNSITTTGFFDNKNISTMFFFQIIVTFFFFRFQRFTRCRMVRRFSCNVCLRKRGVKHWATTGKTMSIVRISNCRNWAPTASLCSSRAATMAHLVFALFLFWRIVQKSNVELIFLGRANNGFCPLDPNRYCPLGGCAHTTTACQVKKKINNFHKKQEFGIKSNQKKGIELSVSYGTSTMACILPLGADGLGCAGLTSIVNIPNQVTNVFEKKKLFYCIRNGKQ